MVSTHKYSKQDIDTMIPFERDVLTAIINERLDKENKDASPSGIDWKIQTEAPKD